MSKKNTKENKARDDGSHAAFLEAAEECRQKASEAFLNFQDQAANALRNMAAYFLKCAQQCETERDDS